MILECVRPFGNFQPGDIVEVPDGSKFDEYYFEVQPPAAPEVKGGGK